MRTAVNREALADRLRAAGCVFAEDEADVLLATSRDPTDLADMVARRASGLPLEQVVGWADFCGIRVRLAEGVFVPRARSALLVETATTIAARTTAARTTAARSTPDAVVVDLCCGSGALGAAVAARVPGIALYAADNDPAAVACARTNLDAPVYQGDLFAALPDHLRGAIDVLVANVPYVPTAELALMPAEARLHEPRPALDGGTDGLDVLRRVVAGAPGWLAPGGAVLMEVGAAQVEAGLAELTSAGLAADVLTRPELGASVIVGRRRAG